MKNLEDRVIDWLQKRQNKRRFDTQEITYQDCMDLMFVLAQRLKKIEKKIYAQSDSKCNL